MSKSNRLLELMQLLRTLPAPVTGEQLAGELDVSQRTIYRYIDDLRGLGAVIDGEAGFGFTVVEDPAMPPMIFDIDEIEALVLGLREVQQIADPVLARAAQNVLSKVNASLPARMQMQLQNSVLHAKRFHVRPDITIDTAALRSAAREERAIEIDYKDAEGKSTVREVLPLSIVFMDQTLVLLAQCQLRNGFRAFRIDRIVKMRVLDHGFKPHRVAMLREFLAQIKVEIGEVAQN